MSSINEKILSSLDRAGVSKGDHILLAFSGGTDSMALLALFKGIVRNAGWVLSTAHLDHFVRGERSRRAALEVKLFCKSIDVPLQSGKLDQAAIQAARRRLHSMEAALRELRYEFLRKKAANAGADWIVTAHHEDDQSETVLFRVLRKMNWRSFAGIREVEGNILRPLLNVKREELEAICAEAGLKPIEDETNLDISFTRNRLRHRVIPDLERSFHPGLKNLLVRMSNCSARLEGWEGMALGDSVSELSLIRDGMNVYTIGNVEPVLRHGLVLRMLGTILDEQPKASLLVEVMKIINGPGRGTVRLPGKGVLVFEGGKVQFRESEPEKTVLPDVGDRVLPVPGTISIPELGARLSAEPAEYVSGVEFGGEDCAVIDASGIGLPLTVRNRRPGDTFQPLGMKGQKKLKDFFIDRKVPEAERDMIPLIFDARGTLVWVAGIEISESVRLVEGVRTRAIRLLIESL